MMGLNHEIQPSDKIIAGLGKRIIPTRGRISLPLKLGSCQVGHTFIICDNVDNEFLMGMDLMQKLHMTIDVANKTVTIPNHDSLKQSMTLK